MSASSLFSSPPRREEIGKGGVANSSGIWRRLDAVQHSSESLLQRDQGISSHSRGTRQKSVAKEPDDAKRNKRRRTTRAIRRRQIMKSEDMAPGPPQGTGTATQD